MTIRGSVSAISRLSSASVRVRSSYTSLSARLFVDVSVVACQTLANFHLEAIHTPLKRAVSKICAGFLLSRSRPPDGPCDPRRQGRASQSSHCVKILRRFLALLPVPEKTSGFYARWMLARCWQDEHVARDGRAGRMTWPRMHQPVNAGRKTNKKAA